MSTINDGGPAFPFAAVHPNCTDMQTNGMSLRDWLAGQAIAGLTANANLMDHLNSGDDPLSDEAFLLSVARGAYRYADAMIAAREKGSDAS